MNEEIDTLKTMNEDGVLSLAKERGYTIRKANRLENVKTGVWHSGWRIGGAKEHDAWMNAANLRLRKIQTEE